MTALVTDNLPILAGAPNGIKKLRELILEIAVRGKLVPQDPSDAPASELLKRIAVEKARLVAEGKIKKQKPMAEIGAEENPFELPEGWEWGRLSDCSKQVTDGEHLTPPRTSDKSQIPLVTAKNVRDGYMDYTTTDFVMRSVAEKCWERCCPEEGDIMMVSVGATLGRLTVVPTNQEMVIVRSVTLIKPLIVNVQYLALALKSPTVQRSIWAGVKQSAQPCLYLSQSTQLLISIPPLAEQHRIGAKVDELMALCDRLEAQQVDAESAHSRLIQALIDSLTQAKDATDFAATWQRLAEHFHTLFTTEFSIDALKQTLLQLAVMGKLVPQDSMDESGTELSKRIQSSRIDKRKIVTLAEDAVSLLVGELPENWGWSSVDQISADEPRAITDGPFGANLKTEHYIETPGYRVVRLQNIGNGNFRNEHRAYIDQDRFEKIKKHQVLPGDLIVAGLIDTSIRCCIAPEDIGPAVVKADCYRFAAHPLISSKYVLYYLNSKMAREFAAIHHHGLTLTRIGLGNFRNIPVPLPPTDEQHRIVTKLDQLMILCDQLKDRLTKARQLNELLAGTLIEQAVA